MADILCGYKLVRELGARALPAYAAVAPKARRPEDALCVVEKLARDADANVDAEAAAIFMRDAKRLSQVRHPNLVHVREVVVGTSIVLLVTNWVDGEVFSDVTRLAGERSVPIPLAGSLRVVVDLLEGLSALHEVRDAKREPLSIVHAEVAPRNVVVGIDGRSVLVHPLRPPGKSAKAHASDVVGYLAPEVLLADKTADQRADVYGVGVILWEALAGRRMHAEGEDTGAIVMRLLGGHVEAPSAPIDAPWAAGLVEVATKAISPDPTNRYAHATEMLAAVRRAVVARLAPKLTVSALVEAVAGERIRARNAELGYVRPAPAQGTSPAPPTATPAARPVRPNPPPFRPRPDDSGATRPVRADESGATRPARADESGAKPTVGPEATKPPIPDGEDTKPPPPVGAADHASERMSIPISVSVVPSAEPGALTNEDRTPLRTVDPVTGEERPMFRSDPPVGGPPASQRRSEPPQSADVIEVVEMEVPVDRPSRPKPPPHAPPSHAPPSKLPSAVPRPPPLPTLEPAMAAMTQSGTDMGSVARVAPSAAPAISRSRWPLVAACAAIVAVGAWLLLRPAAPPAGDATTAGATPAPAPSPPAPSPAPSASAASPAPTPSAQTPTLPANAPGPFDPSSQGDTQAASRRAAGDALAPKPAAGAPAPGAGTAASPAPASSTRSKKRVYDPMGI